MATRKVMEINDNGVHMVCIKETGKDLPYRVYGIKWELDANGYPRKHRNLMRKFHNMAEVVNWLGGMYYLFCE